MKKSFGLFIASIAVSGVLFLGGCGLAGDPVAPGKSASASKETLPISRETGGEAMELAVSAITGCPAETCAQEKNIGCRPNLCFYDKKWHYGEQFTAICTRYFREPGGNCVKQVYEKKTRYQCGVTCSSM